MLEAVYQRAPRAGRANPTAKLLVEAVDALAKCRYLVLDDRCVGSVEALTPVPEV